MSSSQFVSYHFSEVVRLGNIPFTRKTLAAGGPAKMIWIGTPNGKRPRFSQKRVGKVKLYNRLEAQGKWKLGDYPVYPDIKKIPEVNHQPWVWDRLGQFQVLHP